MKCYTLENHSTKDCPKEPTYKICSECSTEGHLWFQCKANIKTCINCDGEHSTMAMKCPVKKALIKDKRKEEVEKSKMTFADTTTLRGTQQPHTQALPSQQSYMITRDEALKIQMCFAHAHYKNIEKPGSYSDELNKILQANNLPSIIVPDTPNSQDILHITPQTQHTQIKTKTFKIKKDSKERRDSISKGSDAEGATGISCETEEIEEVWNAQDIGLKLYTSKERGWPQGKTFGNKDLEDGFKNNIYKWTYDDNTYTEEEIFTAVVQGNIRLKNCWMAVDKDIFRKIRSGCKVERSPIQDRDPRSRKKSL